jgi:phage tail sheath protein FI
MKYTSASTYLTSPGRYASGVVFQPAPSNADTDLQALYPNGSSVGAEQDNKQYFAPVPLGSSVGNNVAFDLEDDCGLTPAYVLSEESVNVKMRRFVLGFQSGFDGQSPSVPVLVGNDILPTNQQGLDCSTNKSNGSYAYKQALAALSNADEWDFNLITIPGINYQYHPYVASLAVEICENRGDAFFIMDIAPNQMAGAASIDNVVELASQFDTNYAGTYYPWVKIVDTNSNKVIPVPPSVVMMGVFAANDAVSAEWFAPAGLNRGGIPAAVQVIDRLTHAERDTLYVGRVNPIAAFPGQGIVAWGQKTLQQQPSALDRINVRRLLIAVKKFIASSSRFLVFEQNVATTRQRFLNIVNPYLEGVQQRSGIYAFKVKMDAENNTADVVDRNILYGQIWIQPAKTAEFVVLDFNVTPTGATFSA